MNYKNHMVVKRDKDWVVDYIFDFSSDLSNVVSATTTMAAGLTAGEYILVPTSKVKVRVSGGESGVKYPFKILATSSNGEVRSMNIIFQNV